MPILTAWHTKYFTGHLRVPQGHGSSTPPPLPPRTYRRATTYLLPPHLLSHVGPCRAVSGAVSSVVSSAALPSFSLLRQPKRASPLPSLWQRGRGWERGEVGRRVWVGWGGEHGVMEGIRDRGRGMGIGRGKRRGEGRAKGEGEGRGSAAAPGLSSAEPPRPLYGRLLTCRSAS